MDSNLNYKTAKFVKRLYKIVNDPEIKEIQWNKSGKSFTIPNKELFLKKALPLISKTKEYAAFVRLLNHYEFTKIPGMNDYSEEYFHSHFVRDEEQNLGFITRSSKYKQPNVNDELSDYKKENLIMRQSLEYLSNNNYRLSTELSSLKEKVDKQDKTINGLIEVLSRVFNVGIQTNKQRALTGESNQLENVLKDSVSRKIEPQSKRRITHDELELFSEKKLNEINQLALIGDKNDTKNNKEVQGKDDKFSMSDLF